jgi:hypothetical protein
MVRKMKEYVGVDLHKQQFTVCIIYEDGREEIKRYSTDAKGYESFKKGPE